MVEANIVLTLLQTVSIMVGIGYYILNIQNNQRNQKLSLKSQELSRKAQEQSLETRQAQLFMYMYDRWSDPEFLTHWNEIFSWEWTEYDDFREILKSTVNAASFSSVAIFFEGVGVLVKRKLVDPSLVDDLMSGMLINFWEKFGEPMIKLHQVRINYPQYFEHVEYLYNVIKPMVESQHPELQS